MFLINSFRLLCFSRYLVADDRSIFLFKDGSQAWDAKEFLIEQERCKEVVIENKPYYGKHSEEVRILDFMQLDTILIALSSLFKHLNLTKTFTV